jgi:hypothetical protein
MVDVVENRSSLVGLSGPLSDSAYIVVSADSFIVHRVSSDRTSFGAI